MGKIALITGITGQDGGYLSEFLLEKGYTVHGIKRRASLFNTYRVDHLYQDPHEPHQRFVLHYGDLTDATNLIRILQEVQPDEIYNLGAQSHVKVSFESPEYTADADALGTLRLLEAIRILGMEDSVRFYQASTSELYGGVQDIPQNEETMFYPRSPYASAKIYAYWTTVNYREAYGIFACNGILFNHESPRRGATFVSRKITRALSRIILGLQGTLYLGNLEARRDWGHARDYVEAMWSMLQQSVARDYVIATGEQYSVRDFVTYAANHLGLNIEWKGEGTDEAGVIESIDDERFANLCGKMSNHKLTEPSLGLKTGDTIIRIDPNYYRPTEVNSLKGDAGKASRELGWEPKTSFGDLVAEMVEADLEKAWKDAFCNEAGFQIFDHNE